MGHTGDGHANLTMQHLRAPCSTYARTLGSRRLAGHEEDVRRALTRHVLATGSVPAVRETAAPVHAEERAETEYLVNGTYGPWDPFDLDAARAFFDGFDRPWWLVGG